jgi:tetratricopeptide (TPR) repeat protein
MTAMMPSERKHVLSYGPDVGLSPVNRRTIRSPVLELQIHGNLQSSVEEIDKALASHRDNAFAHLKARRFAEAHAEFTHALRLVSRAQEAVPDFRISLAVVTGLLYPYGALLIRREEFAAAAHHLDQARQYLQAFETKNLLKSRAQLRQYCTLTRRRVDLECAYLALRQRDYALATTQITRLLKTLSPRGGDLAFQRVRASAFLILAKVDYEQRRYRAADTQVRKSVAVYARHDDAETLGALIHSRLLFAEGKCEDALAVAVSGCQRALDRPGIDYAQETSAPAQVATLLHAVQQAQRDPQLWARVMPDEREEIGEFFVILGALLQARAQTEQALHCLLVAGTLLPQADQIDIPEFAHQMRSLGEQASHNPLAFGTLGTLLVHPLVLSRWEFVEAAAEALGQLPLFPALACLAAVKSVLPQNLPRDTYGLLDEIQVDLEARFGIPGHIAIRLGMRVLSKQSVRFVLRTPIPQETAPRVAELIAAAAHHWRLAEVGMADPNPFTPETEALTDLIEEALLEHGLTTENDQSTRLDSLKNILNKPLRSLP